MLCWLLLQICMTTHATLPHRFVGLSSYSVAKGGENSGKAPSFTLPLSDRRVYFLITLCFSDWPAKCRFVTDASLPKPFLWWACLLERPL